MKQKLIWNYDIKPYFETRKNDLEVKKRHSRNILKAEIDFSLETIWKHIVISLLTTQNKSSKGTKLYSFAEAQKFKLTYQDCLSNQNNLGEFISTTVRGITWRTNVVSKELIANLKKIQETNWEIINLLQSLNRDSLDRSQERDAARVLFQPGKLKIIGFGPKQARNFLQMLGLTKYEIPIDSRVSNWLNQNQFPIPVHRELLASEFYYDLILDAIIDNCARHDIFPCMLDAAIFWEELTVSKEKKLADPYSIYLTKYVNESVVG